MHTDFLRESYTALITSYLRGRREKPNLQMNTTPLEKCNTERSKNVSTHCAIGDRHNSLMKVKFEVKSWLSQLKGETTYSFTATFEE